MSYTVTSNLKSSILIFELIPLKLPSFPKQTAFYKWNCWGKMRGVTLKMRHNLVMFRVFKKSLIFWYAFLSHIWLVCLILVTFLHFFFFSFFRFSTFFERAFNAWALAVSKQAGALILKMVLHLLIQLRSKSFKKMAATLLFFSFLFWHVLLRIVVQKNEGYSM